VQSCRLQVQPVLWSMLASRDLPQGLSVQSVGLHLKFPHAALSFLAATSDVAGRVWCADLLSRVTALRSKSGVFQRRYNAWSIAHRHPPLTNCEVAIGLPLGEGRAPSHVPNRVIHGNWMQGARSFNPIRKRWRIVLGKLDSIDA
jgi:hypothetical protein